jgi:hypothetical protein
VIDYADATAPFDEAQLAAAAILARYSGRTLDAYRHDLRSFFQWTSDTGIECEFALCAARCSRGVDPGWVTWPTRVPR